MRCQRCCRAECSTLNLEVWCQSKHICMRLKSKGRLAVCQVVKVLSPSIFGMTGTDSMDAYLTGWVDRSAASDTRITAAAATTSTTTYLHLSPQQPPVTTQRKHNNHQNSHHELAPQQEEYLRQGSGKIKIKTSPASWWNFSERVG